MLRTAISIGALALAVAATPVAAQSAQGAAKGSGGGNSGGNGSPSSNAVPSANAAEAPSGVPASLFDTFRPARDRDAPLTIEMTADINYSRLAFTGRGEGGATLDPQSGAKQTFGMMMDLGGPSMQGRVRIAGSASRQIKITLPSKVTMTGRGGLTATLTDFVTDLPAFPSLGPDGTLEFSFGARLTSTGPVGSVLRGRIPITVDYN